MYVRSKFTNEKKGAQVPVLRYRYFQILESTTFFLNFYGRVRDLLVVVVVPVPVLVYLSTQFSVWRALNATITSLVNL